MRELAQKAEEVATRAAEKALDAAFARRDERESRRFTRRLETLGAGVAAGGLLVGITGLLTHLL